MHHTNSPIRPTDSGSALHRLIVVFCSTVLLLFTGCEETGEVEVLEDVEYLYFESIGTGQRAAESDTIRWVVRDSLEWVRRSGDLMPHQPFLPVPFEQAMVVVAGIPAESGGYSIEIHGVEKADEVITVHYTVVRPDDDCINTMNPATPFHAVLARQAEGDVVWVETEEKYSCAFKQ